MNSKSLTIYSIFYWLISTVISILVCTNEFSVFIRDNRQLQKLLMQQHAIHVVRKIDFTHFHARRSDLINISASAQYGQTGCLRNLRVNCFLWNKDSRFYHYYWASCFINVSVQSRKQSLSSCGLESPTNFLDWRGQSCLVRLPVCYSSPEVI